jgi:hypothetical protein
MSAIAVGSAVAGAAVSASASQNAANKQSQAANAATNLSQAQYQQQYNDQAPYRAAGTAALGQMQDPRFQQSFGAAQFHQDPGYQFALKQGQDALNASQAAQGNNISGAGLTALSNYNQGMANQQYQNAFNNYQSQQTNQYNRLASLAGLGQTANAQSQQAGQFATAAQNSAGMQGANAQAAGGVAQGNAIGSAMSGLAGIYGQNQASQTQTANNFMNAESGSQSEDNALNTMWAE